MADKGEPKVRLSVNSSFPQGESDLQCYETW